MPLPEAQLYIAFECRPTRHVPAKCLRSLLILIVSRVSVRKYNVQKSRVSGFFHLGD
jgi:hypothetical protein